MHPSRRCCPLTALLCRVAVLQPGGALQVSLQAERSPRPMIYHGIRPRVWEPGPCWTTALAGRTVGASPAAELVKAGNSPPSHTLAKRAVGVRKCHVGTDPQPSRTTLKGRAAKSSLNGLAHAAEALTPQVRTRVLPRAKAPP